MTEEQLSLASKAVSTVIVNAAINGATAEGLSSIAEAAAQAMVRGFEEINRSFCKS